jgi:IPT/TIG domain
MTAAYPLSSSLAGGSSVAVTGSVFDAAVPLACHFVARHQSSLNASAVTQPAVVTVPGTVLSATALRCTVPAAAAPQYVTLAVGLVADAVSSIVPVEKLGFVDTAAVVVDNSAPTVLTAAEGVTLILNGACCRYCLQLQIH